VNNTRNCFLSDRFFELTNTNGETFHQKVFTGHFNILGAASLVFAMDYLTAHDFGQLVERNKMLSNTLRKELLNIGWIPKFHQRSSQSSILSIASEEEVLKSLETSNVRAAYRGGYLRFSVHFYNTKNEIDQLINILKEVNQI
jgi:selenocysteine lyase/cysteine desulfurase